MNPNELARVLLRRQVWGPFLIVIGSYLLFVFGSARRASGDTVVDFVMEMIPAGVAVALILAGVLMMFYQIRSDEGVTLIQADDQSSSQPEYTVVQLSKNYELLRRQTTQGFMLSGVFMALGLLVILSGSAGDLFGLTSHGSKLTTVAGVIMEFISGTSLLIYRINFNRLNETTDKLDSAWRILTAHKLAQGLPDDKRADATLSLINALLKPPASSRSPNQALESTGAESFGAHKIAVAAGRSTPGR
jgi:hypothetical protein